MPESSPSVEGKVCEFVLGKYRFYDQDADGNREHSKMCPKHT